MIDERNDNNYTIPLLEADNLEGNEDMNAFQRLNNPANTGEEYSTHDTTSNNRNTAGTTLSAHPIVSLLTLPFVIIYQIIINFQEYFYLNSRYDFESNQFLATIPKEQETLENDMDHARNDQQELSRDIDDLTRRIASLEERRRKREENINNWMKDHNMKDQAQEDNIISSNS